MTDERYELSDVEVDTLGLVTRGANKEEFFMLKSAEADALTGKADNTDIDSAEPTDVVSESVWRRIAEVIRKAFTMEMVDNEATPVELTDTTETTPTEPVAEAVAEKSEPPAPEADPVVNDVEKTEPVMDSESNESTLKESVAMDENTFVSKAEHESVVQEVAVLKAALAQAQEEKERAVYLTKAQSYTSLPVSPSELADHLFWLSKTDSARYDWFESVIKALDNTMHDANLFVEKGTSTPIENDAITAALKSADPRAALLAMDRSSANAYLQAVRKAVQ